MASARQQHERIVFVNKAMLILLAIVTLIGLGIWYFQPMTRYYALQLQNNKTNIVPINTLSAPISSRQGLLNWATTAVTSVFTFDANNYRTWLPNVVRRYFTTDSGNAFLNALLTSGQIQQVVSKQLIVSSVVSNAPVILEAGYVTGVYSWRVQMPIIISYQSASQVFQEREYVTLLIRKVAATENPYGIAIQEFTTQRQ